mgnify:CR=1 FL=1
MLYCTVLYCTVHVCIYNIHRSRPNLCGAMTGLVCTLVFQSYYPLCTIGMYLQGAAVIALALLAAHLVTSPEMTGSDIT